METSEPNDDWTPRPHPRRKRRPRGMPVCALPWNGWIEQGFFLYQDVNGVWQADCWSAVLKQAGLGKVNLPD